MVLFYAFLMALQSQWVAWTTNLVFFFFKQPLLNALNLNFVFSNVNINSFIILNINIFLVIFDLTAKMGCSNCVTNKFETRNRLNESRFLYCPTILGVLSGSGKYTPNYNVKPPNFIRPKCLPDCRKMRDFRERYTSYWKKNCDPSCACTYESQSWYHDPVIKGQWNGFIDNLTTLSNLHCLVSPGQDEYQYNCHKVRSLFSPQKSCTWDLPDNDQW